MKEAYTNLAKKYDILMRDFDYAGYYNFTKKYLKGEITELACGSGKFTGFLSKTADFITAIDISAEMLNIAMAENFKNRKFINFIVQDINIYQPLRAQDAYVCVCDGLNYIDINDLEKLFVKIKNNLKTNGYFIFDISTEYKFRQIIGENVFYEDYDDFTYLWTNILKGNTIEMSLTFFTKTKEQYYIREDEVHTQHIHSVDTLNLLLENLRFEVNLFDGEDFEMLKATSKRAIFICKKI